MRVAIRVRAGASRTSVGGDHEGALIVRVPERPVDGKATAAALAAVAAALDLRCRDVELVSGATSRTKIVDIPDSVAARFASLRDESPA